MQPEILASAPRCGARTRSGEPCRSPAIHGCQRCRMHGGKGNGAPRGNRNAWKHGFRTASHAAWKRSVVRYLRATEDVVRAARLVMRAQRTGLQYGQAETLLRYGHRAASLALESVEREKKLKAAINTQMQYLVVPIGDARQPFF